MRNRWQLLSVVFGSWALLHSGFFLLVSDTIITTSSDYADYVRRLPKANRAEERSYYMTSAHHPAGRGGATNDPLQNTTITSDGNDTNANISKYVDISVIVPSTLDRLENAPRLLASLASGTRLPREVVYSVSGVPTGHKISVETPPDLNVTIVTTAEKRNAAENRNIAASHSTTEFLAFLDSDDISGPRWMETASHVLDSFSADMLLHLWFPCKEGFGHPRDPLPEIEQLLKEAFGGPQDPLPEIEQLLDLNSIFPVNLTDEEACKWACCPKPVPRDGRAFADGWSHPFLANGHVSVKRKVWEKIKQREDPKFRSGLGEDSWFVGDILQKGYKAYAAEMKLTGYCKH